MPPPLRPLLRVLAGPGSPDQGVKLLRDRPEIIEHYRRLGAGRLEVGTGSFGYQLAFYQHQGFRVTRIERDFFVEHYPEPIIEDGIRHMDMLRLTLSYSGDSG